MKLPSGLVLRWFPLAALVALAPHPSEACKPGPVRPWTRSTEPGVTVRCTGEQLGTYDSCDTLIVEGPNGLAWSTDVGRRERIADHHVWTFRGGALLIAGGISPRLLTPETAKGPPPRKGSKPREPKTVDLAAALTRAEKDRLPEISDCGARLWISKLELTPQGQLRVELYQVEGVFADGGAAMPSERDHGLARLATLAPAIVLVDPATLKVSRPPAAK